MRVLQLTQRFPPALGGVETHVMNLASRLTTAGLSVDIFATDLRTDIPFARFPSPPPSPLPVRRFRAVRLAQLPHALGNASLGMVPAVVRGKWDVVHAHGYGYFPSFLGASARALGRTALVLTPHSDPGRRTRTKRLFDRVAPTLTLRRADRVIALTPREARYLQGLGVEEDRIAVIPNGVDTVAFSAHRDAEAKPRASILFVGRCYPSQKGLEVLVRSLPLLEARPRPHVRIVGEDWGGRSVVRAMASRLGVQDCVTLAGPVSSRELVSEYARADVFVLPSLFESFPIVLLEAMAAGLPVVATRVGGVPDVVVEGETGLLVPPADPEALAHAMDRLLEDDSLRATLGRAGRERSRLYSWERIAAMTRGVYEAVVGERNT